MPITQIPESSWNEIITIQEQAYTELPPEDIEILKSKWLSSPSTCSVYSNEEKKILAYLLAHPWASETPPKLHEKSPCTHSSNLYLHDLALAQEARGKGIAKALVENLIKSASNEGFVKILLVAVQGSTGFWARFGFLEISNKEICPSYGDNAKLMMLELKV